jgi:DNA polymerase III alpha subunit
MIPHYVRAEQAAAHDAWLAMGQSKGGKTVLVTDPNRFAFNGGGYHFRTAAEMHALFDHQPGTHDAVRNSRAVAEMVEPDVIPVKGNRLPVYPAPDGVTAAELLYEKTRQGAVGRWGENLPIEIKAELRHELDVIGGAGFDDYALIVSDIIDESVRRGIRKGPGRGSAAGSRVMYALGVTDIEPRVNDLLFFPLPRPWPPGHAGRRHGLRRRASRRADPVRRRQVRPRPHGARRVDRHLVGAVGHQGCRSRHRLDRLGGREDRQGGSGFRG